MATARINAESLLAIDVGAISTRTMLFDDVEGRYRFLGAGIASSTANAPFKDVLEGIRLLRELDGGKRLLMAHGDSTLLCVARADFNKILAQHAELYEALLRLHARRIRQGSGAAGDQPHGKTPVGDSRC